MALSGAVVGIAHQPKEKEDVDIVLQLPQKERTSLTDLGEIRVASANGTLVPLSELTKVNEGSIEKSIYHKNLKRVVYVTGDVAGKEESPVYAIISLSKELDEDQNAIRRDARALLHSPTLHDGPGFDEVGRGMANHL